MGLFGGSSKSSSTATDKRLVTGEGSTGISADNSNVELVTQLVSNTNQTDNSLMSWADSRSWANSQTDNSTWASNQTDSRSWANSETDNSTVNVTDSGIVSRALDSIDLSNATTGQGFSNLLDVGKSIFSQANSSQEGIFSKLIEAGKGLIGQTQQSVSDAYQTATAEKSGALDNKTLMILGVAAIAGVAIVARGKQ